MTDIEVRMWAAIGQVRLLAGQLGEAMVTGVHRPPHLELTRPEELVTQLRDISTVCQQHIKALQEVADQT